MPAVVDLFREQKDYAGVRELQKDIVRQYRGDFGKHIDAKDLPRIRMVWESIPIQLAKENKKFFFGQIKKVPEVQILKLRYSGSWIAD